MERNPEMLASLAHRQTVTNQMKRYEALEPERILGAASNRGELLFLMKWKGVNMVDLIPAAITRAYYPQVLIQFYETRTGWNVPTPQSENFRVTDYINAPMYTGASTSTASTQTEEEEERLQRYVCSMEPELIVGATYSKGEPAFLVKWKGLNVLDTIPARDAANLCPALVIKFYESTIAYPAFHNANPNLSGWWENVAKKELIKASERKALYDLQRKNYGRALNLTKKYPDIEFIAMPMENSRSAETNPRNRQEPRVDFEGEVYYRHLEPEVIITEVEPNEQSMVLFDEATNYQESPRKTGVVKKVKKVDPSPLAATWSGLAEELSSTYIRFDDVYDGDMLLYDAIAEMQRYCETRERLLLDELEDAQRRAMERDLSRYKGRRRRRTSSLATIRKIETADLTTIPEEDEMALSENVSIEGDETKKVIPEHGLEIAMAGLQILPQDSRDEREFASIQSVKKKHVLFKGFVKRISPAIMRVCSARCQEDEYREVNVREKKTFSKNMSSRKKKCLQLLHSSVP